MINHAVGDDIEDDNIESYDKLYASGNWMHIISLRCNALKEECTGSMHAMIVSHPDCGGRSTVFWAEYILHYIDIIL